MSKEILYVPFEVIACYDFSQPYYQIRTSTKKYKQYETSCLDLGEKMKKITYELNEQNVICDFTFNIDFEIHYD